MIGKQEFIDLIVDYYRQRDRVEDLSKIFYNAFDNMIIDYGFIMFDKLLDAYFNEEGADWIRYYLFENPEKCYYQDNVKIPLEDFNDLWKLIEKYRK